VLEVVTPLRVPARYERETARTAGVRTLRLISRFTVEAGSPLVRVETHLDNTASHYRLRLRLPTGLRWGTAHADASFAVHANAPDRWPGDPDQLAHPMRSFVSVSAAGRGLSVITRGLHEYALATDAAGAAVVEVTLLRAVDATVLCSTWMTPQAQLPGRRVFAYALLPHPGDWRVARVPALAASFRQPPIANVHGDQPLSPDPYAAHAVLGYYQLEAGRQVMRDTNRSPWKVIHSQRDGWKRLETARFVQRELPRRLVPFRLAGDGLVLSAFKRAADGHGELLRFWSWHDSVQEVTLGLPEGARDPARADLLERVTQPLQPVAGQLRLPVRPFEIVTVRWVV
jgi:alpha-mannosidase